MMPVASPVQHQRGPVQTLWLPRKLLLSTVLHPSPGLMPSKDPSAVLHFSGSETQQMWARLLLQAPPSWCPAAGLACSCSDFSNHTATGELSTPVCSLTCRILAGGSSMFRSQGLAGQGENRYSASVMAAACCLLCEQLLIASNFLVPRSPGGMWKDVGKED